MANKEAGGTALTPAAERLVDAASELFYSRGIRAVGVDLIAERAGTTKKTLYDRFGSKDALVALYLERRARRWQGFLLTHLDTHAPARGPGRVLAVFDALAAWMADNDRGCAFINAFAEVAGSGHPALAIIREDKRWMRELFQTLAEDAGLSDPEQIASFVHLLYEGAIVTASAGGDDEAVVHARAAAAALLAPATRTRRA